MLYHHIMGLKRIYLHPFLYKNNLNNLTKNDIIIYIEKNIDFDRIMKSYQIKYKDDMRQIVFMILLEKPFDWLLLRYEQKCLGKVISTIVRNQRNDCPNSEYHKITKLYDDEDVELIEIIDKPKLEYIILNEQEKLYNYEKCLDVIDDIFNEYDFLIQMYKEHILENKSIRKLSIEYKMSNRTIKKRFEDVKKYIKFEFFKKINE